MGVSPSCPDARSLLGAASLTSKDSFFPRAEWEEVPAPLGRVQKGFWAPALRVRPPARGRRSVRPLQPGAGKHLVVRLLCASG